MTKQKMFIDPNRYRLHLNELIDVNLPPQISHNNDLLLRNNDTNVVQLFQNDRIEIVGGSPTAQDQLYRLLTLVKCAIYI
jgi:hypothetical protein